MKPGPWLFVSAVFTAGGLAACGGSDSPSPAPAPVPGPVPAPVPAPPPPPPVVLPPLVADAPTLVSAPSPYAAGCTGEAGAGAPFTNAEVEPHVAVNPRNPNNFVAVWQQDRWGSGSANGLMTATTTNGGATWSRVSVPFSRCAGGTIANGGDYARSTDPWVTIAPDGTAFQMALSTSGAVNAMLVSRSTDSGLTWSNPVALIVDGAGFFNDKNSITADPTDARFVYAVWDRLVSSGGGPTYFARTTDGGMTWEAARPIYDPGTQSQTIGNVIAVLPNGTLVNLFAQLDTVGGATAASLRVVRSFDKGVNWTGATRIADLLSIGARDPENGTAIRDGALIPQIAAAPNGDLWVVWQDARFSGGARDGIALARSTDGGATWSAPAQVNSAPNVQAFMPSIHVRADGTIGITYYDLRSNTADPATLPTELILARSVNGATWQENRISTTFDLAIAPFARGLFLGDYQGLASANNVFIPVYVRTSVGDLSNRTDVYALVASSLVAIADAQARALRAPAAPAAPDPQFRIQVHENIVRIMDRRIPGWSQRLLPPR